MSSLPLRERPRRHFLLQIAALLSVLGVAAFLLDLADDQATLEQSSLARARSHFRDIVLTRRWSAGYGGVYVEKRAGVESSPYLKDPDIQASNGKTYTLRNPALMTREISALAESDGDYRFHITSLKLKNPNNAADDWERAALESFATGGKERFETIQQGERTEFRYMAPLLVEQACMACHEGMGYQVGDLRGGISVRFDITPLVVSQQQHRWVTAIRALLTLAGLFLLARIFAERMGRRMQRLSRRHEDLVQSIDGIVWEADAQTLRFTFVSAQAERLLGFPVAEWSDPGFWVKHLHPDDRTWAADYRTTRAQERQPWDCEYRFVASNGDTLWLRDLVRVVAEDDRPASLRGLTFDVTRQHEQAEQTRRLLVEQETILDNALVGIAYLKHRRVVSCNRRLEEIFGYGPGELIGRSTECLYATRAIFEAVGERAYARCGAGHSHSEELLLRRKDGEVFWGVLNGRAIDAAQPQEGSIWIYADISERRAAEEEVHKLLRAVEQSPVAIVITDRDGLIEYVNPRFCQVPGYSQREAIGENPRLLKSGQTPPEVYREMWETLLAGGEWRGTLCNRRRNGELFWEDASISPIVDETGTITHFLAVKDDITEQRRVKEQLEEYRLHLEELVERRTADLASALEAAKVADKVKDSFLANVSHELRTPLNAVIGLSALARRNSDDPRQRDYLDKVNHAGQTLLAIINDLLDLTKIAAGELRFEAKPFSLRRTAARVVSVIAHRAAEKGLQLEEQIDWALPEVLVGDPLRIEQILLNLLNNAIKFTDAGRIVLRITATAEEAQEVNDPQEPRQVRLRIEVEDSGIGMSEEAIAQIYKPFVQADPSITRKHGGTGLGLAICKQLAEGMHGSIDVSSRPGQGTLFRIEIRLGLSNIGDLPPGGEPASNENLPARYRGARVLVVDDQALNREVVYELLGSVGIVPRLAENGRQALDILRESGPEGFDLVLMDIQMPVMDGLTAVREIRALPGSAALPIIAMTAHTMVHEKQVYLAEGMNDHLGKPFSLPAFFALLARWLACRIEASPESAANTVGASAGTVGTDALPAIAGLDAAAALERFAGNSERYRHWLGDFVGESAGFGAAIDALLANGAREAARQAAHAFKGRVGILGMTGLHRQASALEKAIAAGEPCGELRQQIAQAIDAMAGSVQTVLGARPPVPPAAIPLPLADIPRPAGPTPPSIEHLLRLFDTADGASAAAIAAALDELKDSDWPPLLQAALVAVRRFDFAAARHVLGDNQATSRGEESP